MIEMQVYHHTAVTSIVCRTFDVKYITVDYLAFVYDKSESNILILSAGYFIKLTELLVSEKVSSCFYMCTNRRLPVSS